jgi:hypothetical protein
MILTTQHRRRCCLAAVLLLAGCAMTGDEAATISQPREVNESTEIWRPRPKTRGKLGLDTRAREIEGNLGYY